MGTMPLLPMPIEYNRISIPPRFGPLRAVTTLALQSPSVSSMSTLLFAFAPRARSTAPPTPSPIAVANSSCNAGH
jgi:hypothetical protein